jgi:hypothetical protein
LISREDVDFVSWEQVNSGEISINASNVYHFCKNDDKSVSVCGEMLYVSRWREQNDEDTISEAADCTFEKINLITGEKSVIWNIAKYMDDFCNAVLDRKGERKGNPKLYKDENAQLLDDISHYTDFRIIYVYVGKNRAIIRYTAHVEGKKFCGGLEKLVSIDLSSLEETVLCDCKNGDRYEDIKIAKFDMKNDVMWLQKNCENGWPGDKLYKHKIQPLKDIIDITNCIETFILPEGWGRNTSNIYFDGKRAFYCDGRHALFAGNDGKYSDWTFKGANPLSSYYVSILGPWVHISFDHSDFGEDVYDYFVPNRVELAGENEWLMIKNIN